MPASARILANLPSLYRPEPGHDEDDLLLQLVRAMGRVLDGLSADSAEVMQAHWFPYADSAIYSAWVGRSRAIQDAGPLRLTDPDIDAFPYLADLPRIAALVDVSPFREPLRDRERVEALRRRILRLVRLHRDGLGTVGALRAMTRAALPQVDPDAAPGLRERSYTVEEFSSARQQLLPVAAAGPPQALVGPLMRWQVDSGSLAPVVPAVVIRGVNAVAGEVDPTRDPIVERFDPATGTGVGIHYQGDLAPDQALALVSAHQCWLGGDNGVELSEHAPQGLGPVNPTAAGPWSPAPGSPGARVVALVQSEDRFLWAAVDDAGVGSLWRSAGAGWSRELDALPRVRCLLALAGELWVGFDTGLARLPIQPSAGFALEPDPSTLAGPGVNALLADAGGTLWAATDQGLYRLEAGALVPTALGARSETRTPLRALALHPGGDLYCGGELGVFLYRRNPERWFLLMGEAVDESVNDWLGIDLAAGSLPDAAAIFVPPVNALAVAGDGEIWLGTAHGIARYRAWEQRRTFTTLLQALPQLTVTAVHAIARDARQRLWFASDDGLFVYDRLDWFQRQGDALVRLPRQDEEATEPVFWRFRRAGSQWQWLRPPGNGGFVDASPAAVASAEPALRCVLWTQRAVAHLGSFDGDTFTIDTSAAPASLGVRYKPEPTRIVDGGLPGVPELAAGISHWRYLQREEPAPPAPVANPAWTREGRLLPPPQSAAAPFEGRYLAQLLAAGDTVFSYCPAAGVWMQWAPLAPLAVTVRLARTDAGERIDPLILDRVWRELTRVKPAGVALLLAVDEDIVRGGQ